MDDGRRRREDRGRMTKGGQETTDEGRKKILISKS